MGRASVCICSLVALILCINIWMHAMPAWKSVFTDTAVFQKNTHKPINVTDNMPFVNGHM